MKYLLYSLSLHLTLAATFFAPQIFYSPAATRVASKPFDVIAVRQSAPKRSIRKRSVNRKPAVPPHSAYPSQTSAREIEVNQIREKILEHVYYPRWLKGQEIKNRVLIKIELDPKGRLIKNELAESSGNRNVDQLARDAIHAAAPFERAAQTRRITTFYIPFEYRR